MMYNWWSNTNSFNWMVMVLGGIVLVLLIILLAITLIRPRHRDNDRDNLRDAPRGSQDSAMRILDEKFAKGEIDEEEYVKKKNLLK